MFGFRRPIFSFKPAKFYSVTSSSPREVELTFADREISAALAQLSKQGTSDEGSVRSTDSLSCSPELFEPTRQNDEHLMRPEELGRAHVQLYQAIPTNFLHELSYRKNRYAIANCQLADLLYESFNLVNGLCQVLSAEKIVFFRTFTIFFQLIFKNFSQDKLQYVKTYNLPTLLGACFALAYSLDDGDEDSDKYFYLWDVLPRMLGLAKGKQLSKPMGQVWALLNYDLYEVVDLFECYVKGIGEQHSKERYQLFTTYLSLLRINPAFLAFDDEALLQSLDLCLFSSDQEASISNYACYPLVKKVVETFRFGELAFSYSYQSFDLNSSLGADLKAYLQEATSSNDYVLLNKPQATIGDHDSDNSDDEYNADPECLWHLSP